MSTSSASVTTAPHKSQQNGKAEWVNRTLMERVRAALLDSGAEEELWDEALASVVHVLNRSPKAGLDVTPLEALTGLWGKPPDRGDTTPRHEPGTGREQSRNTPLGG